MVHQYTKFGSKMFGGSGNIIRTIIHWHFDSLLWHWHWLQQSNFSQDTLANGDVPPSKVCLQTDQKFKNYSRDRHKFYYISHGCDFNLEDSKPIFPHEIPVYNNTPPYQVCIQKVERFGGYRLDKIQTHRKTDTRKNGPSNSNTPRLTLLGGGGGGGCLKKVGRGNNKRSLNHLQ